MNPRAVRTFLLRATLSVGVALGWAAAATGAGAAADPPAAPAKVVLGGIILVNSPWGDAAAHGLELEAAAAGVELRLRRHHFELAKESAYLQEFITAGVDAIVIAPTDEEASAFMVRQAHQAGIKIICLGLCLNLPDAERYAAGFIEADNFEIGYRAGTYVAHWLVTHDHEVGHDKQGRVNLGIIHSDVLRITYRRGRGFRAALEDAGLPFNLAVSRQGLLSVEEAREAVRTVVLDHPDVQVIWTDNSLNTAVALHELHAMDLPRPIYLFGTELNGETAPWLLDPRNIAQAVTGQATVQMAREAVQLALAVLREENPKFEHRIVQTLLFSRDDGPAIAAFLSSSEAQVPSSTFRVQPKAPAKP